MQLPINRAMPQPRYETAYWIVLASFIVVTAAAAVVGGIFRPGVWYAALVKPAWNPPNWLFGPVWSVLYVMIAFSGTFAWRAGADRTTMAWWVIQLVLNGAWTAIFFGLQRPGLALIEIAVMLVSIVIYATRVWRYDRRSTWLVVPYIAWVSFASALNFSIWYLNS